MRLRKTPNQLNGRDKQPTEPGAGPEPQKLGRRQRRRRMRMTEKRRERANRRPSATARQRFERWQREAHVELVRQGNRMGIELETVQDRKRICIQLSRAQARLAGVSNATWACATREERAKMIETAAR